MLLECGESEQVGYLVNVLVESTGRDAQKGCVWAGEAAPSRNDGNAVRGEGNQCGSFVLDGHPKA